jgi:hypothetical protein
MFLCLMRIRGLGTLHVLIGQIRLAYGLSSPPERLASSQGSLFPVCTERKRDKSGEGGEQRRGGGKPIAAAGPT